jgi:PAS domain S-box-containing protein
LKVLVADDDPVWRTLIAAHLQRHGYDLVLVPDGAAAAACLSSPGAPRLALLDWVMPAVDGVSLCREVRERNSALYTYLILLTSKSNREDLVAGLASGADDYLTKPFEQSELIARLRVGERVIALHDKLLSARRATESLVANAPFGLASIDSQARIQHANPAFVAMLGEEAGTDLAGRCLQHLFRDPEKYLLVAEHLRRGERFDALEAEIQLRDGRTVILRLSGQPLEQEEENCAELIAEDVTQRFLLEQRSTQAQRVEAIGRFAGSIAHDFNNFLSVIQGCTDLLLQPGGYVHDPRGKLQSIRKATAEAAVLIQQLLAFGRRQVLRPEPLEINELVLDFEPMLCRLCGEEIQFRTALEPGLGPVLADPSQIRQVLMNLVANARDAMPLGGRIELSTRALHLPAETWRENVAVPSGNYVNLAVSDTGSGMDAETQARVFEPFFTTKVEGTGLGLSTTYGIVKQSRGFIWVTSVPQQGTTFEIWLPRTLQPASRPAAAQPPPRLDRSATVLLVEDECAVREVARECLEAFGMTVLEAESPAEALTLAKSREDGIDLLFTDVVMPDMRGNELADRLRQQHPQLKVLFMSGYAYDFAIANTPESECTGFLQKPFSISSLRARISELLGVSPSGSLPSGCPNLTGVNGGAAEPAAQPSAGAPTAD